MEMGFPEDVCAEALERYDGDENLALNFLLGGWNNYFLRIIKKINSWRLMCSINILILGVGIVILVDIT